MRKTKYLSVTIAVLIALVANSAGIAALPGHSQPVMAKEPERLVARSLGLTGTAEEDFVKRVKIVELTGKALQEAVLVAQADAKSQTALRDLRQRGYKMLDGTATGLTVVVQSDTGARSATLLMWDYQGSTTTQLARFLYVSDDQGMVQVAIGLIRLQHGKVRHLRVFEVQGDELVPESAWAFREDGTVVGEGADAWDLTAGVIGVNQVSEECFHCMNVCNALYGGGCSLGGVLFCTLYCIPFGGPICPAVCGAAYVLMCVLGTWFGCPVICGPYFLDKCP